MLIKIITGIFCLGAAFSSNSNLYDYTVPLLEGGHLSLQTCASKKIMVVVLPVEQTAAADSSLFIIDTIAANRQSEISVIAVPAIEDGFTNNQSQALLQWYRSKLGSYVKISGGLYTRKASAQQHDLFKWVTKVAHNQYFDVDASGPGSCYFINPGARLYAVLAPGTPLGGNAVQKVLNVTDIID